MDTRLSFLIALLLTAIYAQRPTWALDLNNNSNFNSNSNSSSNSTGSGSGESGLLRTVRHVYVQCADSDDIFGVASCTALASLEGLSKCSSSALWMALIW